MPLIVMPVLQKYNSMADLVKSDTISLLKTFFTEHPVQYGEYLYGAEISMVTYIYISTLWEYKCGMLRHSREKQDANKEWGINAAMYCHRLQLTNEDQSRKSICSKFCRTG